MGVASYELKLERAREHLHALDIECRAWIDTEPCKSIDEPDPEPPPEPVPDGYQARRLRIHKVEPTPLRLSILIGDCVFNLRSSLDHMALALAKHFTPAITNKQISNSEFPIFDDIKAFNKEKGRKIGCIAPHAQSAIELLQPYHSGSKYKSHPLWRIHELNRVDKHRSLTVLGGFPADDGKWVAKRVNVAAIVYLILFDIHLDYRKPEANAVLVRWAGIPSDPRQEMRMDVAAPFEASFGEGFMVPNAVIPGLQALCDFVGDSVIVPLSKFL